ncbi:hypothetical protein, partial [Yersinia sp. IP36721]|uniref:hypothetical protein n=1 Tax=Yersinia sp. IP36721 TaxID=2161716 RepID=UPI0019691ACE
KGRVMRPYVICAGIFIHAQPWFPCFPQSRKIDMLVIPQSMQGIKDGANNKMSEMRFNVF